MVDRTWKEAVVLMPPVALDGAMIRAALDQARANMAKPRVPQVKITTVFNKVYPVTTTLEPPFEHDHAVWALRNARMEAISFGAAAVTLELDGCKWEWKR